jgi:nitroreductase
MEFQDVVKARTSIRSFSNQDVEADKIGQVLECARLAPSWANKQCWRFIVVRKPEKIEVLAKAAGTSNRWMSKAPAVIVACGDPDLSGTRNDIKYFVVDVAIAMEHLVLAATDLGLGTCWIGAFNEAKVKQILGIPDKIRVVALTPIGYPAAGAEVRESLTELIVKSKNRKTLDEIVRHETWW